MKYRNRLQEVYVNVIRVIALILIVLCIIVFSINPTASIVLILVLTGIILLSRSSSLEIRSDQVVIEKERFLKFLSSRTIIEINMIDSISYSPARIKPLIVILPGHGGLESARIEIKTINGQNFNLLLRLTKAEQNELKNIVKKPSP